MNKNEVLNFTRGDLMEKHYFTFPNYPTSVQVIHTTEGPEKAKEIMFNTWGSDWAFQYTEEEWQQSLDEGYFKNAKFLKPIIS